MLGLGQACPFASTFDKKDLFFTFYFSTLKSLARISEEVMQRTHLLIADGFRKWDKIVCAKSHSVDASPKN